MKKTSKIIAFLLCACLCFPLAACNKNGGGSDAPKPTGTVTQTEELKGKDGLHKITVTPSDNVLVNADATTAYTIVYPKECHERVPAIAATFARNIGLATDASVPYKAESGEAWSEDAEYIVIGDCDLFAAAGLTLPAGDDALGQTGVYIKTVGKSVFINANYWLGLNNGTFVFLEHVLGHKQIYDTSFFTVEKGKAVNLPTMEIIERPDFEFADFCTNFGEDNGFANRLSNFDMFMELQGTGDTVWHNSFNWVDADARQANPKWVSEDRSQLCYTAHGDADELKEMQETVADIVIDYLDANPDRLIITFTQEDNVYVCDCDECTELKQKYGTDAAAYVIFTNKIAELVDAHYAELGTERDYLLMNFAYQMTEQPPVENAGGEWKAVDDAVMLHEKTGVYIASTVADYSKSFYDEANAVPREQIEGWRALTDNMFIWLYQTNFSWYMLPHNTFEATLETYRFCKSLDMVQINQLGQYSGMPSPTGFHRFKSYFDSQAMFNVNLSYAEITDKFFANYFGPAEEPMRKFFDELVAYMNYLCETDPENVNGKMHCNDHQAKYWPKQLLNHWLNYVDEAYTLIAPLENTDPELYEVLHDHINIESLFPRYALIEFYSGTYPLAEEQAMKISFRDDIRLFNNTYVWEWNSFRGVMNYTFEELFASWGIV